MIKNGTFPIVGDGQNRRSMAYVDNICQALLLAERSPDAVGQALWIADRKPYTMNTIVDVVERLMETEFGMRVSHRRMRVPSLIGSAARLGDAVIQSAGLYI
jgi:nucleoside-diphosphate-sugar epimerase